jgi:WD40 repeat protein
MLATGHCLLLASRPAEVNAQAQNPPSAQEQELLRQLQAERAARKALTYQADMRKAALLAEAEDWSSLRTCLDQYQPASGETDPRAWEWHFLDSLHKKKQLVDRQEFVFQASTEGVHQLAWSGNGQRLAAVGEKGPVMIWDLKTGKELRRLGIRAKMACLDHEGELITLSAENGTVTLWPTAKGPARRFFGPIQGLFNYRQPAFSPDGRRLALAVEKTVAAVYDTAVGRQLYRLAGHGDFVTAVVWDPKGEVLATGGRDGMVRLWDAAGKESASLDADDVVEGVQWGAEGQQIAAVTSRGQGMGQVRIWDVATRKKLFTLEAQYGNTWRPNVPRAGLYLSADAKRVAAEAIHSLTVWETAAGRPIFQGPTGASGSQLGGCDPEVKRWGFLSMFGNRAACRVIDMETSADLLRVDSEIPMNNFNSALAWSPDGKRLAAGYAQGKVYVFRVPKDRREVRMLNTGPASFFEWSRDGRRFAFSTQGEVRIGRLPVTEQVTRPGAPLLLPAAINLSPDGRYLAGADRDGTLPIWDLGSGQLGLRLAGHPARPEDQRGEVGHAANALLWSPDAKRLASLRFGDGDLRIWDVPHGTLTTFYQFGSNQLQAIVNESVPLVWSRDGEFLAVRTGWQQKRVRILEAATGNEIRSWDGGPAVGSSNAMAWDSTGEQLATCLGNPPKIQVWNVATAQEALSLGDQGFGLIALSWSPDGRRLAYQGESAHIYDFSSKQSKSLGATGERLVWKPDASELALVGNGSFSTRYGSQFVDFYDAAKATEILEEKRPAFPDPAAMRARSGGVEGQNYAIGSVVWAERGLIAAAQATAGPGSPIIVVWDVRTRQPLLTLGQAFEAVTDRQRVARVVCWSHDGRSLATLSGDLISDARIEISDSATGRKKQTFSAGRINFRGSVGLTWSPDGRSLAFAGQPVKVWKLDAPGLPLTLRQPPRGGPEADASFMDWSSDGRSLTLLECFHAEGHQQILTSWDMTTAKERFRWARPGDSSSLHAPIAWSPDGKRLAWGGPKPVVMNVETSQEEFPLAGHSAAVFDVAWSPDGRRVVSRSEVIGPFTRSFELKVWDTATAQEVLMLRGPMAGWRVAPGFRALSSPPGMGSDPGDVVVWDLGTRN